MSKNNTSIYGLIGFPVKHSLSPAMHNAAFKHLGINVEYKLFEIKPEELEDFLLKPEKEFLDNNGNVVRSGDITCFNITIPHKVRALQILGKQLPPRWSSLNYHFMTLAGAINTAKRTENGIEYLNTDAMGFVKSLQEDLRFNHEGKTVLLLGCGGAARAIISGLCWPKSGSAIKIYVTDISIDAVKSTKEHFATIKEPNISEKLEFIQAKDIVNIIGKCDLLVNTTPIGMKPGDGSVIEKKMLPENLYIYDIVYNRKTKLLEDAESLGLKSSGGLGMLLYQGVYAFNFWTGKEAPVNIMKEALKKELEKCQK